MSRYVDAMSGEKGGRAETWEAGEERKKGKSLMLCDEADAEKQVLCRICASKVGAGSC